MKFTDSFPWMTAVVALIALIVVIIGGVTVITGDLDYQTYLDTLWKFAIGAGILGVGRGIQKQKRGG